MKSTLRLLTVLIFFSFLSNTNAIAQSALDYKDPVITYNPSNPPSQPAWGTVGKWVRSNVVNWNSDGYKCYIYKGMPFRLMFPKNYDTTGATKYPMIIMWHGRGESANIYDNERSMRHGGQQHRDAVNNGDFDGFVFYPQNQSGFFSPNHYDYVHELINDEFKDAHVDLNRIGVHGLSAGGSACWNSTITYPEDYACSVPMSASSTTFISQLNKIREITFWQSQGGQDKSPAPTTSQQVVNAALALGMSFKYTLYENLGHGVWNTHYNEPDFFPFFMRHNKTNPLVYFRKTEFCPGDVITATLALTAGFDGYQWRKDGVIIPGATSHVYTATALGTYDARIIRGNDTSYWSPTPVVLEMKSATITPPIELANKSSNVIPSPDGANGVTLKVTGDFEEYEWKVYGNMSTLGTNQTFTATTPNNYVVSVTEEFGCASSDSPPFLIINGNGANAPATPTGATATPLSKTSMYISWADQANPTYNETGFELYRSTTSGSNYEFVELIPADVLFYIDENLISTTDYYYLLRAINNNGASANTAEFTGTTLADTLAPTVPANLMVTKKSGNSVSLKWDRSTDDAAVDKYEVYLGKYVAIVTEDTFATVYGLTQNTVYNFVVKARDHALNRSAASNQVTEAATFSGLNYEYYHGDFTQLPDFSTLTPVETGVTPNVDISVRQVDDYFAFKWEGYINIPVAGKYTFETYSDDGSKLYIGGYGSQYEIVDNDGLHGNRYREGDYTFPAPGPYPIYITFFERTGGHNIQVFWKNTAHGVGNRQEIPDEFFGSSFVMPCCPPAVPYNLSASALSHQKIQVNWLDSATNETGFQIYRSADSTSGYVPVGIVGPNVTSYIDQLGLNPGTTYYYQVVALGQYGSSHSASGSIEELGDINSGVGATDNRNGSGFIMYSKESVHDRFTSPSPHNTNSDHVIAIVNNANQWQYDNNNTLTNFSALPSDLILARVDFSSDQIWSYEGVDSLINGMAVGFASGDLQFFADKWNGGNNNGEFTVEGTYFNRHVENMTKATTHILAGVPTAPGNLTSKSIANNKIELKWNDNSTNELGFIIRRSLNSGFGYLAIDTIPATNNSVVIYVDSFNLAPHSSYFYEVIATNNVANTTSNEVSGSTINSIPTLNDFGGKLHIPYTNYTVIELNSIDNDGDAIAFSATNLPAFASLVDNMDGTGSLIFGPTIADTNVYPGVIVSASDQFGGLNKDTFDVYVSDNILPTLDSIPDVTVSEGGELSILVSAFDSNGVQTLTWDGVNLPDFVSIEDHNDGTATITFKPYFDDGGSYVAKVKVTDDNNADAIRTFNINVQEKNENIKYFVNLKKYKDAPFPWVNITSANSTPLTDGEGAASTVEFDLENIHQYFTFWSGKTTGNNSGVVPDNVLEEFFWIGPFYPSTPQESDFVLRGLDTNSAYNFSMVSSSRYAAIPDNGHTVFSSQGKIDSVHVQNNTTELAVLEELIPNSNGEITIHFKKGADAYYAYLNGVIVERNTGFNTLPAAAKNLSASFNLSHVELEWYDAPYNETGYNVFRSDSQNGTYTQINNTLVPANSTSYKDLTAASNVEYFYKIQAINVNGVSPFSNVASVETGDVTFSIVGPDSVSLNEGGSLSAYFQLEGNTSVGAINWSGVNLPSFVTLTPLSGDSLKLDLNPTYSDGGPYNIFRIKAMVGSVSAFYDFKISVGEINPNKKMYVNYKWVFTPGSPWLNINTVNPTTLLYDDGISSNIKASLSAPVYTPYNLGAKTGNNSGIVPDNVLREYYFFGPTNTVPNADLILTGLSLNRDYNISIVSSIDGTNQNGPTIFSVNGQIDSVITKKNTSKFVTFEGLVPDSTGKITIEMTKSASAAYGLLNAFILDEVVDHGSVPVPGRLLTAEFAGNSVLLEWYDAPYNETGYNVYRSNTQNGPYYQINFIPLAANTTSFVDFTTIQNGVYFYKIKAVNKFGESAFSDYASPNVINHTPQLTLVGSNVVNANNTVVINANASDANNDVLTFSASNLPTFATFTQVNNGKAKITLNPTSTDLGNHSFTVKVEDTAGAFATKTFNFSVTENILSVIKINFNQYPNAAGPAPWNNMNRAAVNGDSLVNVVNENNTPTGVNMYLETAFGGVFNQGAVTGNNSGVVPDNVLREYYWFGAFGAPQQVKLRIANLDNTKKYRFKFMGSSIFHGAGITDNGETIYTIGNQSVALDVEGNSTNFGVISDVIADFNGDVEITITKANGVLVGYINALIIETLPGDPTAFDPKDLTAAAVSGSAIDLNWADNSFDETNFILERCTTGVEIDFTPYDTLPANTVSYTDTGLTKGTVYYYRVRGKKNVGHTAYTNIAASGTIAYKVYININGDANYNAPTPWNNLSIAPFDDDVFTGFKNDEGIPTGMEMTWLKAMQGSNDWGASTGNNTGVYPDTVMRSFFFSDAFDPAGHVKLTNMSQQYKFNFKFFGSIVTGFNINTNFIIGSELVTNSQSNNTTQVVGISGIQPDLNNEIFFKVQEAPGSNWAIFNAMVIEAVNAPVPSGFKKSESVMATEGAIAVQYGEANPEISIYPNPTVDQFVNIKFNDAALGDVKIIITDLTGRIVNENVLNSKTKNGTIRINLADENAINSGMYIVKVQFADGKVRTGRLIKY